MPSSLGIGRLNSIDKPFPIEIRTGLTLDEYAKVPSRFEVVERAVGLPLLRFEPVEDPYFKDYDAVLGNHPTEWEFDFTNWLIASAFCDGQHVGGVIVGWFDSAVLWDVRVLPTFQERGIGRQLVEFAERWAASRGAEKLEVETQDNNAAACRFYSALGYQLVSFEQDAYPDLPGEAKLIWSKILSA